MSKKSLYITLGVVVVIVLVLVIWVWTWSHAPVPISAVVPPQNVTTPGSQSPAPVATAPTAPVVPMPTTSIAQVPVIPARVSASIKPSVITLHYPGGTKTITATQIAQINNQDIRQAATAQPQQTPNGSSNSGSGNGSGVATTATTTVSLSYLSDLAAQMGFLPLSSSYDILYGTNKIYFAARNQSSTGNIVLFSYDTTLDQTQIAVLPDVGLGQVSDIALSPSGRYLVLLSCFAASPGCYRLSYDLFVFDLGARGAVSRVMNADPEPNPNTLVSFGQWTSSSSFSYNVYSQTSTTPASDTAVIGLGSLNYAFDHLGSYSIP